MITLQGRLFPLYRLEPEQPSAGETDEYLADALVEMSVNERHHGSWMPGSRPDSEYRANVGIQLPSDTSCGQSDVMCSVCECYIGDA